MTSNPNQRIECSECKYVFSNDELKVDPEKRKPCPNCGSLRRNVHIEMRENIVLHDYIGLKAKKASSKHKKNRADYESERGIRKGRDGKLVFVSKSRDREHPDLPGSYMEYVRDNEGNIIVNKDKKLSEHRKSKT